jgi:hypothetical protein
LGGLLDRIPDAWIAQYMVLIRTGSRTSPEQFEEWRIGRNAPPATVPATLPAK